MKLTSQQRLIAALFVTAGIMFAYSMINKGKEPKGKTPAPKGPTAETAMPATAAPTPATGTARTAAPTPATAVPTPTPGTPATAPAAPSAVATITTPLYTARFEDGGLAAFTLARYPADKDQYLLSRLPQTPRRPFAPLVKAGPAAKWEVDNAELRLGTRDKGAVTFTLREGDAVVAQSRLEFSGGDYEIKADIRGATAETPVALSMGSFKSHKGDGRDETDISFDAYVDDKKIREKLGSKTEDKDFRGAVPWAALRGRYFIIAAIAPGAGNRLTVAREKGAHLEGVYYLEKGGPVTFYVGPKKYDTLKRYGLGLQNTIDFGWSFIGWIAQGMLMFMNWLYGLVGNYGVTILVFSILMRLLTLYPTALQLKSSQKMQEIQPLLKDLKDRYKDDPERQNAEMMAIYKKYKINPFSGCLPLLLQMPIFWALFNMLRSAIELKGAAFCLWMRDLSAPDVLFEFGFKIPLVNISSLNVLPIIMTAASLVQTLLSQPRGGGVQNEQQKMMAFMPIIFLFLFYNMPSGLTLYWTVNTLLTIPQYFLIQAQSRKEKEGAA